MPDSKRGSGKLDSFRSTMKKLTDKLSDQENSDQRTTQEYEREIEKLEVQIHSMEEEVRHLTRSRSQLDQAYKQNEKLVSALQEAKGQIEILRAEVEKLTAPPSSFGIFSSLNSDETANIYVSGRKMKVNLHPNISAKDLKKGQELVLNEALNVVEVKEFDGQGEVVRLKNHLDDHRAVISLRADEERVAELAEPLLNQKISVGDHLLFDSRSGYILEKLPKSQVEELVLEEIPDVSYENIGGLAKPIETIRDSVELPFLHPDLFAEHKLLPPKGVLLYGPPGCGKTLIAKAVANSLAKRLANTTGEDVRGFFLHVKGPELLNKYVGESERQIREVFQKAKEKADEGMPVIVFFDEMDALFRTRGTGISSDVESTIVPQFLSEIDGVESLRNVIVIGASNRQDLIDPAILRPGRLDIKIRIDRPDETSSREIFLKYLTPDLPYSAEELERNDNDPVKLVGQLSRETVEEMFSQSEENKFLEVTYANGEKADEGMPVIVFFDEMDALFRTRGTGISSDVESTIVPQFLSEIDGVESLRNVIVIGASNRQDLIDPAILRPGRLDIKIRIDRPDETSSREIFLKYLTPDLPYSAEELERNDNDPVKLVGQLSRETVEEMFSQSEENKFLEVTYANGEKETFYYKDFVSGAMIESVVSRAKRYAIKRAISTGEKGIQSKDLLTALHDEFKENEDLPNTTNPDDWAKIAGRKRERIINIRTVGGKDTESRQIEMISTGHYL